jgi:hypothetical protein
LSLMSQNELPEPSIPYAFHVRYAALNVAMIERRIITTNFFIEEEEEIKLLCHSI